MTVSQISRYSALSRPTVYSHLSSLAKMGLVVDRGKDNDGGHYFAHAEKLGKSTCALFWLTQLLQRKLSHN